MSLDNAYKVHLSDKKKCGNGAQCYFATATVAGQSFRVWVSYQTVCAIKVDGIWWETKRKYSRTTGKQLGRYFRPKVGYLNVHSVPDEKIDDILENGLCPLAKIAAEEVAVA